MATSHHRSTPSLLSRVMASLTIGPEDLDNTSTSNGETDPAEAGSLLLSPAQVQELCHFIQDAKEARDIRVPLLEVSLAEANVLIAASTNRCLELEGEIVRLKETMIAARTEPAAEEIGVVEGPRQDEFDRLKETLQRYENAIALYKGDQHMRLTDAITKAFEMEDLPTSLQFYQPTSTSAELSSVGCETDEILPSFPSDIIPEPIQPPIHALHVKMMEGCWMYKYPRSRFHKLIGLPCIPLGRITYRFFWLCPLRKCICWSDDESQPSRIKMITIDRVVLERRLLEQHSTPEDNRDGVEVIVVVPREAGRAPLAIIPTGPEDYHLWKEVLPQLYVF